MIDTQLASLLTSGMFIVIGLYAAIFLDNIIKKIIGLSFIEEGANLFLITLGYRPDGIVPILMPGMSPQFFAEHSAYPLPQALVLTSIVIGASTLAVMIAIAMILYKKHGSLSASKILGDKNE
jgi:energy-converting hydrogenase B subunit E